MSVYELLEQVKDRDSFLFFLESLAKDYDENHDEWENWTISDYLERISAWIKDSDRKLCDRYPRGRGIQGDIYRNDRGI